MEVPLPFWWSFYPVGYPSFFLFFFYSDRFVPFVFMAFGHLTAPRGPPKYQKKYTGFPLSLTDGYAMLKCPSKGETAVHGCHCSRDMAVRMREVMTRPWVGVMCAPCFNLLVTRDPPSPRMS